MRRLERCLDAGIVERPVDAGSLVARLWDCGEDVGAVALYVGRVKGRNVVLNLRLVDRAKALEELRSMVAEVASLYPNLRGALLYTHVGPRKPGEPVSYIAVAAVDRETVFNALRRLVEGYKSTRYIEHVEEPLRG